MKNNNKWFSIALAIWLVIFINLIALWILEYIIPFSKNTKWIENSLVAYYQANSAIERALFEFKSSDVMDDIADSEIWGVIYNKYSVDNKWSELPPPWEWNSEYDPDWNQIAMWNPIQLQIWYWKVEFSSAKFAFRVPDLKDWTPLTLSWWSDLPIINWQISSQNNTLNSSGSQIFADNFDSRICSSNQDFSVCNLKLDNSYFEWVDLNWPPSYGIEQFYTNNCVGGWSWCILKLSVVNKLETDSDNISIPYLEWKIDFGWINDEVPLRYAKISTIWKAYWYRKDLEVKIPQQTTNEAFDFTVFQ